MSIQKNNIYKTYQSTHPCHSESRLGYEGSYRYFKTNFLTFLPQDKHAKILDIGCGAGHFIKFLQQEGYTDYIGVDISEEQVEFCKRHVTKNVNLIKDLRTYLQKNREEFDFILMNDVIEHISKEEIIETLSLVYDSLKKNSIVIIRTVNLKNRWGMAVRYMDFTHTAGFTEESIRQIMLIAGFKNVSLVSEIHPVHDIKSFIRVSMKKLFEFVYRLEYIASFGAFNPMLSNMIIAVGAKSNHDEK